MLKAKHVLWGQGLHLSPQLFQQQTLSIANAAADVLYGVQRYSWGGRKLEIDTQSAGLFGGCGAASNTRRKSLNALCRFSLVSAARSSADHVLSVSYRGLHVSSPSGLRSASPRSASNRPASASTRRSAPMMGASKNPPPTLRLEGKGCQAASSAFSDSALWLPASSFVMSTSRPDRLRAGICQSTRWHKSNSAKNARVLPRARYTPRFPSLHERKP